MRLVLPAPLHARRNIAVALAASLALLAPWSASRATRVLAGTTWSATSADVIVIAPGHQTAAARAVTRIGGHVGRALPIVDGFSARVPENALGELRATAGVSSVSPNSRVAFSTVSYDDQGVASAFAKSTTATTGWSRGLLGDGVGVAVIDTGVSDMRDLAGRVVHGPDLSGEGTYTDTYGHGTFMAGLIGGSGEDSAGNPGGAYTGVAPHAKVIAVKTAGRNGVADVSTILAAMHWVSAYASQYNIRVLNLSWGTSATTNTTTDPLDYAVERLWRQGIVVVVSAGNSGPDAGTITKPADDPMVLTVGAFNDKGSSDPNDDNMAAFSSRGPTAQGVAKPDVVAPGRTLIATRSYGSAVEADNPKSLLTPSYMRGSGSSEAAAVTSGVAALLLQAHPNYTPDQVKAVLRGTAAPMSGVQAAAQGAGRVRLGAALDAAPGPANWQVSNARGLGPIEGSRGGGHIQTDCNNDNTIDVISGEITDHCQPWDGATWTGATWTGATWTGATWTDQAWTGATWTGATWTGATWTGATWTGGAWDGATWTGATWTGATWTGATWTGATWTGSTWTSSTWTGSSFDDETEFETAFWGGKPHAGLRIEGEQYTRLIHCLDRDEGCDD